MGHYAMLFNYTEKSAAALAANPQDRAAEAANLFEAVGGKLHQYYFAIGEYDGLVIAEVPDTVSYAALALAVAGTGSITNLRGVPLLSMDDAMQAMRKAGELAQSYRPPAG